MIEDLLKLFVLLLLTDIKIPKSSSILLANLLSWVNVFAKDFIEIERPNYSQIIKIKK